MSDDYDTPEFKAKLLAINEYYSVFYAKLEKWMEPEITALYKIIVTDHKEYNRRHNLLKNARIKEHVSSTHKWVPGKSHYVKECDNWGESALECSVCKLQASEYEEVDYKSVKIKDIPSRDSHNNVISRTCEEVVAASKKKPKGKRCIQCWTYGCLWEDI